MTPSPDLAILRWLASHGRVTASQIAAACAVALLVVRARMGLLERERLVSGRQDVRLSPAPRVFWITLKGLRAARVTPRRARKGG